MMIFQVGSMAYWGHLKDIFLKRHNDLLGGSFKSGAIWPSFKRA